MPPGTTARAGPKAGPEIVARRVAHTMAHTTSGKVAFDNYLRENIFTRGEKEEEVNATPRDQIRALKKLI